jgi:hypothetical protein
MFFKMSYVTRDFYYGDNEIHLAVAPKKIDIALRKRRAEDAPPPVEQNDGLIVAICDRELSERIQQEVKESGALSLNKAAVRQVFDEMSDCIVHTLHLLRWRTGSEGSPNPIRMGTADHFAWSPDGIDWKRVDDSRHAKLGFELNQLGSSPTKDDIEFIQSGLIEGLDEPLGHQLLREANVNRRSNPRSALILAVAAAEVGFKHFASRRLPDTSWLLELPSPPVVEMLTKFPWSEIKLRINGKVPAVPNVLIEEIRVAVTLRNSLVHSGVANLSHERLNAILDAVRDLLYFLDSLQRQGQAWALRLVRHEITSEFGRDGGQGAL